MAPLAQWGVSTRIKLIRSAYHQLVPGLQVKLRSEIMLAAAVGVHMRCARGPADTSSARSSNCLLVRDN